MPTLARIPHLAFYFGIQYLWSISYQISNATLSHLLDLPSVKPSAIALGTVFNHTASLAIMAPVFGDTYRRAQAANSKEEFFKSKEATSAVTLWSSSLIGSTIQSYGVGALINATGTLSYKGAAYLGSLIFMASSAPSVSPFHLDGTFTSWNNY
jgi:hypothetical protein